MNKRWAWYIFGILSLLFFAYSASIYLQPSLQTAASQKNSKYAAGKQVWQNNNCQSCHQIYGLGGYLGPDITNVASKYKNRELALKAIIQSGNKRMPAYRLNEQELEGLLKFFKTIDESGAADPRSFRTSRSGMIYQELKDENQ